MPRTFALVASVGSQEEQDKMREIAEGNVWLGGKRNPLTKEWNWLDGRQWGYQNWQNGELSFEEGNNCVCWFSSWKPQNCSFKYILVCLSPPETKPGNHTFYLKKYSLENESLNFWWSSTNITVNNKVPGLKLRWSIKNGSLPDVRKHLNLWTWLRTPSKQQQQEAWVHCCHWTTK